MKQPNVIPIFIKGTRHAWILLKDFVYKYEFDGRIYALVIPKGFITDLASVPRILWTISGITPDGLHRAPALVHDFLYRHKGQIPRGHLYVYNVDHWVEVVINKSQGWSKTQCDKLFARALREYQVDLLKRRAMYRAVRIFGWFSWWSNSKPSLPWDQLNLHLLANGEIPIPQFYTPTL